MLTRSDLDRHGRVVAARAPTGNHHGKGLVSPAAARSAKREHGRLGETAARQRGEWGHLIYPQYPAEFLPWAKDGTFSVRTALARLESPFQFCCASAR